MANPNVIEGTDAPDYLHGQPGADLVIGYGADDVIFYLSPQDMQGDTIAGGAGFDELSADFSSATTALKLTVLDSDTPVTLLGATIASIESYSLTGTKFADSFTGGVFDDRLEAGGANDVANGGLGDDTLFGQLGTTTSPAATATTR